jgi:putative flippase GtrA
MPFTAAQQRYNRRVLVLCTGYALFLFLTIYLLKHQLVSGALAYAVGVLPALPVVGCFVQMGRYLTEESDEYVRQLVVRQQLAATGLTLSAMTVWGFLEGFELVPHVVAFWWPVLWIAGLGLGACAIRFAERRA